MRGKYIPLMPIDMALLAGAILCLSFAYPGFGSARLTASALLGGGALLVVGIFLYARQYAIPHKKMRGAILAVRHRVLEMIDSDLTMFTSRSHPLTTLVQLRVDGEWVVVEYHDWAPYTSQHVGRRRYRINAEGVVKRGIRGENLPRSYSSWHRRPPTLREFEALLHELHQCSPRREVSRRT